MSDHDSNPNIEPLVTAFGGQLEVWLDELGEARFRASQIRSWYLKGVSSFEEMTNLSRALRTRLADAFALRGSRVVRHQVDEDGTEKLLLQWDAGGLSECVLLRDGQRRTVCLSSQVGCAMGCVFCASGIGGLERNLSWPEIVEQAITLAGLLPADERLSHVVMMGMGEPLANLDAVLRALELITSGDGLGISRRRVTISTVGIPKAIRRLAEGDFGYHLAISLHAADDDLRTRLVPVNRRIGVESIVRAADDYFDRTGRRLTFEYVLLAGVNDSTDDADRLARLLRGRSALVNLIPYNEVKGLAYRRPAPASVRAFREVLERSGLSVQIRRRKGARIDAACGQLRFR